MKTIKPMDVSKLDQDEIEELENQHGLEAVHGTEAVYGKRTIIWTPEQLAIFEAFKNPQSGNLVVQARAGTGKTSTIKSAFQYAPERKILYAVFNKRNQMEAQGKITDPRVEIRTLHSLGYKMIRQVWSSARADDDVEYERCCDATDGNRAAVSPLLKLVGFVKNLYISPTIQDVIDTINTRDVMTTDAKFSIQFLADAAMEVLDASKERDPRSRISFNDMVWLPCALDIVKPCYDLVVIDEAQDMNAPQLMMARQACNPNGRVVVVGDSSQAIYNFRGAHPDAMNMMQTALNATVLPLTITHRCPKTVVELAAKLVPDYRAADDAPEGIVSSVHESKIHDTAKVGDAILSRLNAPLMPLALSFLRRNIPARIEGRDIGKQLLNLIKSFKVDSLDMLHSKISGWRDKQTARICRDAKDPETVKKQCEVFNDIAETLNCLTDHCDTVQQVEMRINDLFADTDENSKPSIVLSTVHKAKGLEWDRVFLIESSFKVKFPSKGNEQANIRYVAITRAKKELYLVNAGKEAAGTATESTDKATDKAENKIVPMKAA